MYDFTLINGMAPVYESNERGLGCCAIVAAPAPAPSPTYSVGRSKTIKFAVNVKAKERNVR